MDEGHRPAPQEVWVFHRGSLGDGILLWPMLRAMTSPGSRITLVTDGSKARLAERELGVVGLDVEQRRFNSLWVSDSATDPIMGVSYVLAFLADGPGSATWVANAVSMFPGARVERDRRRIDRVTALEHAARWGGAPPVPVRRCPTGPIVAHVGAGGEAKRWPMPRWERVVNSWRHRGARVDVIAGEVERERLTPTEHGAFDAMGGRFIQSLTALGDLLKSACAHVGCDTGPTHLAAALGVPTVALFGPTDPAHWAPIGPMVAVVRAENGHMESLEPEAVCSAVEHLAR
jgi:ADP-heptose:LPS heptosyltransferase